MTITIQPPIMFVLSAIVFISTFDCLSSFSQPTPSTAENSIEQLLAKPLLDPALPWKQLKAYVSKRIPVPQPPTSLADWEAQATQIRKDMLDKIVFRGEAQRWRDSSLQVKWFEPIETGDGYRIKKFSYEILPGFWAPALLYEPTKLSENAPVFINLNGHHRGGKAMPYKQRRCINLAKRGILAYNLEFIDMGQLHAPNNDNRHNRLVQIDLCGTSGLAPFWLVMQRGLDIALAHESADPNRVGVAGLSGGGWQTIWLASLDTRITLVNPVAGYGSNQVRLDYRNNVGDAEQIPADMCLVGDYTHMTALVAPRPLLLTNNEKDDCCFRPNEVYPRLKAAAEPIYHLYDQADNFRTHINYDPGTHNFESDNREALHRLIGDYFFPEDASFDPSDITIPDEKLNTEAELAVPMPESNATLHSLALELSQSLPANADLPNEKNAAQTWQSSARKRLHELVRFEHYQAAEHVIEETNVDGIAVKQLTFQLDDNWTLPAVMLTPDNYDSTVILINDEGRTASASSASQQVALGRRVVVIDLTGFGEASGNIKGIEPLLIDCVGGRALGVYAAQLATIARWSQSGQANHEVSIVATGPRSSTIAMVAAALETKAISALQLHGTWGTLKHLITENMTGGDAPEQFCFGLLKELDIPQIMALVAPRHLIVHDSDEQTRSQLSALKPWYATLGVNFDPIR